MSWASGVEGYKRGERVTSLPISVRLWRSVHPRRRDALCEDSQPRTRATAGAYAEYVLCGAASLLKLPANVSSRAGALVERLSVGLHAVNRAQLKPGMGCVVMGAGPLDYQH